MRRNQRIFIFLVEDVGLHIYVLSFIGLIIVFGVGYKFLSPGKMSFGEGIYISIITISSLGYADVFPMGFSKVLASIEVLIGLILMGIMIAKLTSQRLSHHVSHIFGSDARNRLNEVADNFNTLKRYLRAITSGYESVYQTPSGPNLMTENSL